AGRGGEGVVLASQIMADALGRAGFWVQSFPEFTAERRGAPISAYLRWDERPIHRRYKMRSCDVLAVVSPSPPLPRALGAVRRGGIVILNREARFPLAAPFAIARVPASRIARRNGILSSEGRPMGNVALLGACMRMVVPDGVELLVAAVESRLGRGAGPNVRAAREGYACCVRQRAQADDVALEPAPDARTASIPRPPFPVSAVDSRGNRTGTWS